VSTPPAGWRSAAIGRASELAYAAGWGVVKAIPDRVSATAFRTAADLAVARNGRGVQQLRANYRRVLGPDASSARLEQLVTAGMRSYARYWREAFRLPKLDPGIVTERLATTGMDHLDVALERGRGAIFALPHQGNWDASGLWLVQKYGSFTTVVERLEPESLFNRFVAYRESLGFEIVPLTGGARPALEVLRERLRQNRIVCLVSDRDLSRSGVEVSLFGEPARIPGGPAVLAATTGAALLPVGCWFTDDAWGHRVSAPIPVPEGRLRDQVSVMTQALADGFAAEIRDHPADWHMLQKLWLADLPSRGAAPAAAPLAAAVPEAS
jgi:KDO2-lipid IV(A) lauroyltransferase